MAEVGVEDPAGESRREHPLSELRVGGEDPFVQEDLGKDRVWGFSPSTAGSGCENLGTIRSSLAILLIPVSTRGNGSRLRSVGEVRKVSRWRSRYQIASASGGNGS